MGLFLYVAVSQGVWWLGIFLLYGWWQTGLQVGAQSHLVDLGFLLEEGPFPEIVINIKEEY